MADITMCSGQGCSIKESCYRFMAMPNEWRQAFFSVAPVKDGVCGEFCPTYEYEEKMKSVKK